MKAQQPGKRGILFLCSYNSVRSQIAEGLMCHEFVNRYEVFSAGVTNGGVSPYAVAVMLEIGVDISRQHSKSIDEFKGRTFDVMVTLCDHGKEACVSILPKCNLTLHHDFPAPDEIGLPEEEVIKQFRDVREQIQT
jgi:arsenate reductase (thioredoxin)